MNIAVSGLIDNLIETRNTDYERKYSQFAKLHKYWARKPWFVIQNFISKYSNEHDVILDPFCGSGLMGLEAILQNRDFIGYDLNPIASFLAEKTLDIEFDASEFDREFQLLETDLKQQLMSLYAVDDGYLVYSILGTKSSKSYNAIVSDYYFQSKVKLSLDKNILLPVMNITKTDFPIRESAKSRICFRGGI
jgi:hypothetical protein